MNLKVTFVFCLFATTGCSGGSSGAPPEISEDQAKERAVAIVPGTAGPVHRQDDPDAQLWAVEVKLSGGQEVTVEVLRKDGTLDEIDADEGPFDYDLPAPLTGMITLAQARAQAEKTKQGNVEAWEFHATEKEYEVYVRDTGSQLWEIKLAGDSGQVTSVAPKDKPD